MSDEQRRFARKLQGMTPVTRHPSPVTLFE